MRKASVVACEPHFAFRRKFCGNLTPYCECQCKDLATSSDIYLRTKGAAERRGVELLCTTVAIGDIENAEASDSRCKITITTATTTMTTRFISQGMNRT